MNLCTRIAHEEHPNGLLRTLAFALAVVTPMCGQSLDETLTRMDKTAQQFKSVTASMKRDNHTSVINDDSVDAGTIKVKRDKSHDTRMLVDITGSDAKTVSLEDSTVSVYYPKIKTVQKYDVGEKKQLLEQFLLLGFGASTADLKQAYDISWVGPETIEGQPTGHLKLNPKPKGGPQKVTSAELWISSSNGLPLQQKIVFSSGDYWVVNYSDLKFNPPLSDDDLKLKYPKGVQIDHPRF